jgi:DNA-directed RNA polymerase subunit beta'
MNYQTRQSDFDELSLKIASPEKVLEWSNGEVTKPETMNYRTQRSEKNGLFDERIFGPEKDFECYCGKYKGIRYKGIICEKCGVEITRSIVRRERMGHIELATPVSHVWFLRSMPSRIGLLLMMTTGDLEKVVYFAGYLVININEEEKARFLKDLDSEFKAKVKAAQDEKTKEALKDLLMSTKKEIESIKPGIVLDEIQYHKFSIKYGSLFEAKIGAEAIYEILQKLNLEELKEKIEEELPSASAVAKVKMRKRLELVSNLISSGNKPEWMFLKRIPVIPPALRPMVALEGGRHATSDLNDLYRRVINRNNRLAKLQAIYAPDVILRNEKRILQEAVDALMDNSMRHGNQALAGVSQAQKRPLKSLSDNLKGKKGIFRSNLLGKRVDYSARSVIVVGPKLALNQCGLPKHMALELFRPFVVAELLERELAYNIRGAGRLIDEGVPEVWEVLEEVIEGKYVLLNRAPTLHRLGIQAFRPILIEGNAIQVHPLVCTAFNADFDGDMMAVHLPLSEVAQYEAREIMASDKNILKPGSGDPTITSKLLDIILGVFWVTKIREGALGEGMHFPGPNSAKIAMDYGALNIHALINVRGKEGTKFENEDGKLLETTVGRIIFNEMLPEDYPYINEEVANGKMQEIVDDLIARYGVNDIAPILDKIKDFGFEQATKSGTTWGIDDIVEPEGKDEIIDAAKLKVSEIEAQYSEGLLSDEERHRMIVELWHGIKGDVEKLIPATIDPKGSVYDMVTSGARGSIGQITNMAGMKGLIVNSQGETIETPIISSGKSGLSPIEYFITTYGSRKGLTDTALNTAKAGYLTRRLFDVAQDVIITEHDCGTTKSVLIEADSDSGIIVSMSKKVRGRTLAKTLKSEDGTLDLKKGHIVTKLDAIAIEEAGIKSVEVKSPMTCETVYGVCSQCYGTDLGNDEMIDLGEAVGTIAAQAIGEPGTQLTMRTFHAGGTASVGGDITQGLPRVEEIFERRKPKTPAVIARVAGMVTDIVDNGKDKVVMVAADNKSTAKRDTEYVIPHIRMCLVKAGDVLEQGQLLTDGSVDLQELFKYSSKEITQDYVISQVNKIYELQGASVSRKHIEVIIRQMFSRGRVTDSGDTPLTIGEVVDVSYINEVNNIAKEEGKKEAEFEQLIMGISEVSLTRRSFLSSASFQHTSKILISHAVKGSKEVMRGLKENVILGRLIPAGSGFEGSKKQIRAAEIAKEEKERLSSDE